MKSGFSTCWGMCLALQPFLSIYFFHSIRYDSHRDCVIFFYTFIPLSLNSAKTLSELFILVSDCFKQIHSREEVVSVDGEFWCTRTD